MTNQNCNCITTPKRRTALGLKLTSVTPHWLNTTVTSIHITNQNTTQQNTSPHRRSNNLHTAIVTNNCNRCSLNSIYLMVLSLLPRIILLQPDLVFSRTSWCWVHRVDQDSRWAIITLSAYIHLNLAKCLSRCNRGSLVQGRSPHFASVYYLYVYTRFVPVNNASNQKLGIPLDFLLLQFYYFYKTIHRMTKDSPSAINQSFRWDIFHNDRGVARK